MADNEARESRLVCPHADTCPIYRAYYNSVSPASRSLGIITKKELVKGVIESYPYGYKYYQCIALDTIHRMAIGKYKEVTGRLGKNYNCGFVELLSNSAIAANNSVARRKH